jgi:hypothetical protein
MTSAHIQQIDFSVRYGPRSETRRGVWPRRHCNSWRVASNGNRTRVTHPDGQAFSYTYDGLNVSV